MKFDAKQCVGLSRVKFINWNRSLLGASVWWRGLFADFPGSARRPEVCSGERLGWDWRRWTPERAGLVCPGTEGNQGVAEFGANIRG